MSSVLDVSEEAILYDQDSNEAAEDQGSRVIFEVPRARMYSSSALHAARHFSCTRSGEHVLALADELQHRHELPAVAVVDQEGKAIGIVSKDRLFGLLGKSFGREVLTKTLVAELAEVVPIFDAHADLFAVASVMLASGGGDYCLLVGPGGRFLGLVSSQDLSNYLSRMTQEDIELAGRLQERLLAMAEGSEGNGCSDERYLVEAWSRPAKGVGGDFYFTKTLPDGRLFLALCDVSGKGVAASLIVSMVWGMLTMFDYGRGLSELVVGINESIVTTFHLEKYLTGIFLIFDPKDRRLHYADMGHSHSLLFRSGKPRSLKGPRGNLPVGVETELEPAIYGYKLQAGDRLFIYSDGLTEQENGQGQEFGERRLVDTALAGIARGESLREAVPAALDAHRNSGALASAGSSSQAGAAVAATTPQQDDMSFLLLTVR
jgi:Serine phosphatase RsbU, regulator of sigma subunit